MKRFNLWFSLVVLLAMGIGSYYAPDGSFFWLASVDMGAQVVRMVLILLLSVQLFTEPPRHLAVRLITGAAAIGTAVWALQVSTFMNTPIFDTVILLQTAIALGVSALELQGESEEVPQVVALHTVHTRKL